MKPAQMDMLRSAITAMRGGMRPLLYGPNGQPLAPSSAFSYSRSAAKRSGSLKNWNPRIIGKTEADERERIVARSIDLVQSDPHASGITDLFSTTVVGAGLIPHPDPDPELLDLSQDQVRALQARQRAAFRNWSPIADAGGRLTFCALQFLVMRCFVQYGEFLVLLPMVKDATRCFSLACQVIHPLRLKTPSDMQNSNIRDGVELGEYGRPVAYWIKKTAPGNPYTYWSDTSENFLRIPAKHGHRWKVLHGFMSKDAEQVRGIPMFAPAMKFFRDLNDYLDAELVSNIVTAAFSLFIEVNQGSNPEDVANILSGMTDERTNYNGDTVQDRYQELNPGSIMYGNSGEKPHTISANRPGATFEPFTKVIKKAISSAVDLPYAVAFKDVENTNYAGFRSAMLDAWRVFTQHREWLGDGFCQPVYTMLQEEAYLRDYFDAPDFYRHMHSVTRASWRGAPKGDIEPIKAVKADILAVQNNLKSRSEVIAERGGDLRSTLDQLQEEQEMLRERGLDESPLTDQSSEDTPDERD